VRSASNNGYTCGSRPSSTTLFTNLGILSNLLSISTLFIFTLVAMALFIHHYYAAGETAASDRNRLVVCLAVIVGSCMATAAY
jgi:APA family basic amino acid/polyamine antiporter